MQDGKFTEEDLKKYIEALNFIAKEAEFPAGKVEYSIKVRNHFAFLQSMAAKVEGNILEVKGVTELVPEKEAKKQAAKRKSKK